MAKKKAPKPPSEKLHPAEQYIEDVLSGKIVAGKLVRRACERQKHDLEHAHKRGFYFDREAAQHAIDFARYLHHSKGKWAGKPLILEPWQQFIDWCVFGWKNKETGFRRFRTAYESVARKNGKSTKIAKTGLYGLVADKENGAEIYAAATKRDQARIIFGEAQRMRTSSPYLKPRVGSVKNNLHVIETNSKFEPLGADEDSMDGLNVHFALVDELHAHKTRGTWDLLDTATGSRQQSLLYAITTAGVDRSPKSICWEQHRYGMQILDGFDKPDGQKDDSFFCYIATIDAAGDDPNNPKDDKGVPLADDPFDERCWIKANPNLGVSVSVEDLRRKALKAKSSPAALNTFLRLHLNQWTDAVTVWIPTKRWDDCGMDFTEESLEGQTCYGGLDLASTRDIAAFTLVFPRDETVEIPNPLEEKKEGVPPEMVEVSVKFYKTIARYWVPEATADTRSKKDLLMYNTWIEQGYLKETEGDTIDHDVIHADILRDSTRFKIELIAYDRYMATQLITQLQGDDIKVTPFGQGFVSMNAPSKEVEKLIFARRLEHNRNPVTRWMLGNVAMRGDAAGNIKPDKEKSVDKIDGIVSLIEAIGASILEPVEVDPYANRGLRTT